MTCPDLEQEEDTQHLVDFIYNPIQEGLNWVAIQKLQSKYFLTPNKYKYKKLSSILNVSCIFRVL